MRKFYLTALNLSNKSFKLFAITFIFLAGMVPARSLATKCPFSNAVAPSAAQTRCVGVTATALTNTTTYTGTGTNAATSFQWYYNTTNTNTIAGATAIAGATSSTYTPLTTAAEVGTRYYFCVGYNTPTCGSTATTQSLASNTVQITVNALPATPTITAGGPTTFCTGGSVTLTSSSATNNQWYNGATLISGATNQTYSATSSGTYTVVVTNASNCTATSAGTTVTVNALPTISGILSVCAGSTTQLTGSATADATTPWTSSDISVAMVNSTGLVTGVAAGTSTITYKNSNGCTKTATITVNALPDITISGSTPSVCFSTSAQTTTLSYSAITNSPTTYSISWSPSGLTTVTNASLTASPITISIPASVAANTYTGTLTVKNANGCVSASKTFTVTVNPLPSVASITGAGGVCMGSTITLSDATAGGIWSVTNGTGSATISSTGDLTGISIGSVTVTYTTAPDANGCTNQTTKAININGLPTITTSGTLAAVCYNTVTQTTTLAYSATTRNPTSYSIDWATLADQGNTAFSFVAGGGTITGINVPAGTAPGIYTGTMTIKNGNGCTTAQPISLTVNALPDITIAASTPDVCYSTAAQTTTLDYTATSNNPTTYSISWSPSGLTNVTNTALTASPIIIAIPAGAAANTYTGTLTVQNANTCVSASKTFTLTIHPLPQGALTANGPFCSSGTGQLTWTASAGTGPYSIVYSDGTNNYTVNDVVSGIPFDVANNPVTTNTTYSLVSVTDQATSCVGISFAAATADIIVNTPPDITKDPTDTTVCATYPAIFTVDASGTGLTYQWYKDGVPLSDDGNITGSTTNTLQILQAQLSDIGAYSVLVSGQSPCTPVLSSEAYLNVNQQISITSQPVATKTLCQGSTFTISASASGTINSYKWYKNSVYYADADFDGTNKYSLTINNVTTADAGTYQLVLDDGSGTGCPTAVSNPSVLKVNPPSAGGTVSSDQTICSGSQPASLTVSGKTGAIVKWESSSDAAFTSPIDINVTTTTITGVQIGALTSTTYFRAVVKSGVCPSDNSSSVLITVNTVSVGGNVSSNQTICTGSAPSSDLTLSGYTGNVVKWQSSTVSNFSIFTDLPNTTNTLTAAQIGPLTTTTYFRAVVQSGVCSQAYSDSIKITVNQNPSTANAGTDQTICGTSATLAGNNPTTGTGQWSIISGTGGTIANPSVRNSTFTTASQNAATYTLRWTISNGSCAASYDDVNITFYPPFSNDSIYVQSICHDPNTGTTTTVINQVPPGLSGGNGVYTYSWQYSANGNSSWQPVPGETGPSLTLTQGTNYFYKRTVTSACGSETTTKLHVNVNNSSSTSIQITPTSGTVSYCNGGAGVLIGTTGSILGVAGEYTVTYQLYRGTTAVGSPVTGTGSALNFGYQAVAGTYTVKETITFTSGSLGCTPTTVTGSVIVTVSANVTAANAGASQTVCNTAILAGNTPSVGTGLWSLVSGSGTITDPYNPATTVNNFSTTTNVFQWKITNGACADSAQVTVIANLPNVVASLLSAASPTICNGSSTTLTESGGSLGTGAHWQWYTDASYTTLIGGQITTSNAGITVSPTTTTTYYLRAEGATAPCASTTAEGSITVYVNPRPTSNITSASQTICNGSSTPVTVALSGTSPWSLTYSDGSTPTTINGITTNPYTFNVSPTTSKTYTITGLTDASCASLVGDRTGSVTINVNSRPTGSITTSSPISVCKGTSVTLTLSVTGSGTLSGTLSDGTAFSGTAPTINVSVTPVATTTYTIASLLNNSSLCASIVSDLSGSVIINVTNPVNIASTSSSSFCLGSAASITVAATGASSYQWQVSTSGSGGPWTSLTNTSPYSGVTTATLNISSTTIAMVSYYYRVRVVGVSPCGIVASTSVPVKFNNQWVGNISNDWNDANNWTFNQLPSFVTCSTVLIPAGTANQPKLSSNTVVVPNLVIASGANLDLNGYNLEIDGTFTGSTTAYLKGSTASGLTIGGNASSLYFDPSNNILKKLTINSSSSATLGNALNITAGTFASPGTLTVNGTFNTSGFLTLKSDANGDAQLGYSTGIVNGDALVERFIPSRRAWRFLTAPFKTSNQSINAAWQEGQTSTTLTCPTGDPTPSGLGTQITNDNTGNGYDLNTTINPSIKVQMSGGLWAPPLSTLTTKITDYPAYYIFVRGDRQICLIWGTAAGSNITTLRAKGTLNQLGGTNTVTKTYSGSIGDHFLLGNPYASPINVQNIINGSGGSGYDAAKIWVWDPKLAGDFGVGGYVTYEQGIGWVPAGGSYASSDPPIIQSGQGFMVQTNSTSTTVQLQETDKTVNEANVFGAKAANQRYPTIFTNLMQADSVTLLDGVAAGFSNKFSSAVDANDAEKLWNIDENMALARADKSLSIELRPLPAANDTLFYKLYLRQKPYVLKVFAGNLTPDLVPKAWLIDKYLNTQKDVNLYDTTLYSFTPNKDTNSYRNRFMLVFKYGQQMQITTVAEGLTNPSLRVFPNPVMHHSFSMELSNFPGGNYNVFIYDSKGILKLSKELEHIGNKATYNIRLPSIIPAGVYTLVLKKDNLIVKSVSLLVIE